MIPETDTKMDAMKAAGGSLSRIPIRCALAKHHPGDHSEIGNARKPCGAVIRYGASALPALSPEDTPPDSGPAGTPEEHRQRVEDGVQEEAVRDDGPPPSGMPGDDRAAPWVCVGFEGTPLASVPPYVLGEDQGSSMEEGVAAASAAAPAPQPTAEELTAAVEAALAVERTASDAMVPVVKAYDEANAACVAAIQAREKAANAKARHMAATKTPLVTIGGVIYRAKPPRKRRGQPEDTAALWGLEEVEVGK